MFAGYWTAELEDDMDLDYEYADECDCELCRAAEGYAFDFEVAMESEFEFECYWLDHGVNPNDVYAADAVDVCVFDTAAWAVQYSTTVEADSWSVQV